MCAVKSHSDRLIISIFGSSYLSIFEKTFSKRKYVKSHYRSVLIDE